MADNMAMVIGSIIWVIAVLCVWWLACITAKEHTIIVAKNAGQTYERREKTKSKYFEWLYETLSGQSHLTEDTWRAKVEKENLRTGLGSLVVLAIEVIILSAFALDALIGKQHSNGQAYSALLKMGIFFVSYIIIEHLQLRDISERLASGNMLFHASGYYRKAIFALIVIHTHVLRTMIGFSAMFIYIFKLMSSYLGLAMETSPFEILDVYTDGIANILMCVVTVTGSFVVPNNVGKNKFWFFLAAISEIAGFIITNIIWYNKMSKKQFRKAYSKSIFLPIVTALGCQLGLIMVTSGNMTIEKGDWLFENMLGSIKTIFSTFRS